MFVLQQVPAIENVKMIGVYSTEAQAREAVTRLSLQPGFAECLDGFYVEPYELDKNHWTEGYITITPDDDLSC